MTMKKKFCIVSIVLMNSLFVFSQTRIKDVYEFPVKPGTAEWGHFETIEKRIAVLQMPDAILSKISTEGLLETCLEFPYLLDILYGDHAQHGFERLMAEFNGFRELFKRSDLTNVLLERYRNFSIDVAGIRAKKDVDQGMFTFRHFVLEFMLTQDAVFENLSREQEKQLFLLSFEHRRIKRENSNIFGKLNDLPVNLLYAKKILNDSDYKFESAEIKKALSDFIQAPVSIDQRIIDKVDDYINVKYKITDL
jgi:hypothetical protein